MKFDSTAISQLLPHRPPILILEAAEDVEPGVRGTGIRTFAGGDSFFEGHFPGRPILPGVYIIEALAQTAMLVLLAREGESDSPTASGLLAKVNEMKFLQPVTPGQEVRFSIEVERRVGGFAFVSGRVSHGGKLVAEGRLTVKIA